MARIVSRAGPDVSAACTLDRGAAALAVGHSDFLLAGLREHAFALADAARVTRLIGWEDGAGSTAWRRISNGCSTG